MTDTRDLLFEIGCEELPASFVAGALDALPKLADERLKSLRLDHGPIRALGTPRRLTLIVEGLATEQPNLEEKVQGPPVKAAFKDGEPTKAAEAFAKKLGCTLDDLERVDTPKGEYLAGVRREDGRPASELLPETLAEIVTAIPFRKSMRWGEGEITFGRPLRWLAALFGDQPVVVQLGDLTSAPKSYGHRFLHPEPIVLDGVAVWAMGLGAAGAIILLLIEVHPYLAPGYTLLAFVIVIIGGLGSLFGALLGGVLIGLSEAMAAILFQPSAKTAFSFGLLIIVLLLRPQGLLGKAVR